MMLLDRIIQRVFKVMLDVGIDSQPQAAAFQGHFFGLVALLQCVAPSVDGGEHHTILPGEHIVIFQLQPAHTGVVYIGKAQHAGQKFPLRVPALGVLIDADAGDAVLFTKIPHAVGGVALHAVAQKAVVGGAVTEFFQQLRFVQLQYFRKALRGKAELFLRHLARGGPQCPAAAVGGQQKTVGAVNAPPVCGDHGIPQLLALRTVGIEAVGAHLQEKEPHGQPQADGTEQHRHGPCPAAESPLGQGAEKSGHDVTPFNGLTLSVIADAMPPLPKGEALAFDTKFMILSKAPPLGELAQSA